MFLAFAVENDFNSLRSDVSQQFETLRNKVSSQKEMLTDLEERVQKVSTRMSGEDHTKKHRIYFIYLNCSEWGGHSSACRKSGNHKE